MTGSNSTRRHPRFKDLTGKQFGKWTVLGRATDHPSRNHVYWTCRCECGTEQSIRGDNLNSDRSHGCNPCGKRRHGMTDAPEYVAWEQMHQRCNNPNSKLFPAYGRNGIVVCASWKSFEQFYADMGPKPSASHSNDRIDGSKGYSCGHCEQCVSKGWTANCRWATPREQSLNRSSVRMIEFHGETLCLTDWATKIGICASGLSNRLSKGWTIERALTTPSRSCKSKQ